MKSFNLSPSYLLASSISWKEDIRVSIPVVRFPLFASNAFTSLSKNVFRFFVFFNLALPSLSILLLNELPLFDKLLDFSNLFLSVEIWLVRLLADCKDTQLNNGDTRQRYVCPYICFHNNSGVILSSEAQGKTLDENRFLSYPLSAPRKRYLCSRNLYHRRWLVTLASFDR